MHASNTTPFLGLSITVFTILVPIVGVSLFGTKRIVVETMLSKAYKLHLGEKIVYDNLFRFHIQFMKVPREYVSS